MHTLNRNVLFFALCLSALAGYVDAIGFLELGGYFVSFMSGNSTRLAVNFVTGSRQSIFLPVMIIGSFVTGAGLGAVAHHLAKPAIQVRAVLLLVTLLLALAAACHGLDLALPAMLLMTLAMGAENSTLRGDGNTMLGVTYMTGSLAKLGQRLALTFMGRHAPWRPYLFLWSGLIAGGAAGAALFHFFGLHSLWLAALWAAGLTMAARLVSAE
ncbi:MAG: DUF1275 domain-containing protein [Pseudomonadota bacterium]|nr:DUF1275 domain-containing protein [Pseudomonadota bacterium]